MPAKPLASQSGGWKASEKIQALLPYCLGITATSPPHHSGEAQITAERHGQASASPERLGTRRHRGEIPSTAPTPALPDPRAHTRTPRTYRGAGARRAGPGLGSHSAAGSDGGGGGTGLRPPGRAGPGRGGAAAAQRAAPHQRHPGHRQGKHPPGAASNTLQY